MTDFYDFPESAFAPDTRIEVHPATDLFMRGARYGSVVRSGRTRVTVKLDTLPNPVAVPRTFIKPVDS